jgi:hypothetical protein
MKSLFEKSKEEVTELFNIWENETSNLFSLNLETFINLSERIKTAQKVIQASENPRLIILESWLIIDFTVRHLLSVGLGVYRFQSLKLSFLPFGSRDCLKMLQDLIKDQKCKPINPTRKALQLPGEFFKIINKDKDFFQKFIAYNLEYDNKVHVEYDKGYLILNNDPRYRNVTDDWFNRASQLSEEWFKVIDKINNVRNFAAHSFDEEQIYIALGIKGKNKIDKLKKYCNKTLNQIIGIK